MSKINMLAAAAIAALMIGGAPTASADEPADHLSATIRISEAQARAIAFSHGLIHIEEVSLLEGRWELAGRDGMEEERVIELDARTGSVLR